MIICNDLARLEHDRIVTSLPFGLNCGRTLTIAVAREHWNTCKGNIGTCYNQLINIHYIVVTVKNHILVYSSCYMQ